MYLSLPKQWINYFPFGLLMLALLLVLRLLSACAASVQGIQNLSLGLRYRHYIPAYLGRRNKYEVADNPVWVEIGICVICFMIFGTKEETYLALYAAGVFILLSLTGWAAVKRLSREARINKSTGNIAALAGTVLTSLLTSIATLIIFEERFTEGAWSYLLLIPALYWFLGLCRKKLGIPGRVEN
jgi:hypothetical protein